MKKLLLILGLLAITSTACAETYILIDKETKEVKSISPIDDAQLESGWEKIIIDTHFREIKLQYRPIFYKYIDGKFIANYEKIDAKVKQDLEDLEQAQELRLIEKEMQQIAIKSLKAKGKEFKHYKEDE